MASAKWYSNKKNRQIQDQRAFVRQLKQEQAIAEEQTGGWIWSNQQTRDEWYATMAHLGRGFPSRNIDTESASLYRSWCEDIDTDIENLRQQVQRIWPDHHSWDWLSQLWIRKIIRQMAIREVRCIRQTGGTGPFDHIVLPLGPFDHPRTHGRLWTTSIWYWIWLLGHLGNHREDFGVVWSHLQWHGLVQGLKATDLHQFMASSVSLNHWIRQMSQNIEAHLATAPPEEENTDCQSSQCSSSSSGSSKTDDPPPYITQPPSPVHSEEGCAHRYSPFTDSDSESIPSSLDTFLFETFTADPTEKLA